MKTKYDINQVPEEVLKRLAQSILTKFQHKGSYPYGCFEINVNATELVEAAKVKFRTKAEVDADIVKTVRQYAEINLMKGWHVSKLSFTANVPGTSVSFPARIAALISETTAEEAETF